MLENVPHLICDSADEPGATFRAAVRRGTEDGMRRDTVAAVLAVAAAAAGMLALATATLASETVSYSYDAKGRLVRVAHAGSVNNGVVANYSFDKADNRTNLNVTGAP